MAERKLGRGLDGLLEGMPTHAMPEVAAADGPVSSVPTSLLDPNPQQPRRAMATESLERMKESIREHGVLQPIVVRKRGQRYQIIAGERRFRAAEGLGLAEVPVVVRDVQDDQMLELALVENLQREDLDPIEKADSFKAYLASSGRTQEEASVRLGLDRSTMANMIRLLDLPVEVQALVRAGMVAMGHARAILSLEDAKREVELAERVAREGLSVRQVERLVASEAPGKRKRRMKSKGPLVKDLEAKLREAFGTKVSVEEGAKPGTGRIIIEFYSQEDLDRIVGRVS
ncbi:MAG: ParB/RepB/Spo0J family partition protein [Planctomycetota bacterium]|nr:ParB/RepB/Spo0J family partition protein [Planctomycetota bacterium]